jgi:hypothetical protein
VIGEWETGELLAAGGGGAADAAAGWGGDRYELWQRSGGEGCGPPCPEGDAFVVRWRWDSPKDQREFETALRHWVSDGRPSSGGAAAVARSGDSVTLALAPDTQLAERLAGA